MASIGGLIIMKKSFLISVVVLVCIVSTCVAQVTEAEVRELVPYTTMRAEFPDMTYQQYLTAIRDYVNEQNYSGITDTPNYYGSSGQSTYSYDQDDQYLGELSTNPYAPNSTSNQFGQYGSPYSPNSINNPYGQYGNSFSSEGVSNPYSTSGPSLFGQDGQYLGELNSNPYDPNSTSNPYGQYGSPYSPTSINNPFSTYGSQFSDQSATNPFATSPPVIFGGNGNK